MQVCTLLALNTKTPVNFFLEQPVCLLNKWIDNTAIVWEKINKEARTK